MNQKNVRTSKNQKHIKDFSFKFLIYNGKKYLKDDFQFFKLSIICTENNDKKLNKNKLIKCSVYK